MVLCPRMIRAVDREEPAARRRIWAWALYDWGNSAFATTVVAGFFPVFFKDYWSGGVDAAQSTFQLGLAVSVASLVVAMLAPALGVALDQGASRRRLLGNCASVSIVLTATLAVVPEGFALPAIVCYSIAFASWLLSIVVYDSMLILICKSEQFDRVSGLGYAVGYLGGGLLFSLNVAMVLMPTRFGLADATSAVKVSFLSVAVWWLVFSIPLFRVLPPTTPSGPPSLLQAWSRGLDEVRETFRELRQHRHAFGFLLAFWLYIDGVDTVYTMAVDIGKGLGFSTGDLISALLLVQFVAFPCAWLFGVLAGRVGAKTMLLLGISVYLLVTILATQVTSTPIPIGGFQVSQFHLLALLVGTAQGGVQALSRSLFSRLIPAERAGEFFGFYNLIGRFAAILGPLLIAIVTRWTSDPRLGFLSVGALLIAGGALLWRLDVGAGIEAARRARG